MAANLTQGKMMGPLVGFTMPLILGSLFQLTCNAAGSIMAGRFAGKQALAAMSTAGLVMNIIAFIAVGAGRGTGVLMSEYFGAGQEESQRREVDTTLAAVFFRSVSADVPVCVGRCRGHQDLAEKGSLSGCNAGKGAFSRGETGIW